MMAQHRSCSGKRSTGFTLIEVLVALSICAMAGIAAMQISGEHINHLGAIQEQTYGSWVPWPGQTWSWVPRPGPLGAMASLCSSASLALIDTMMTCVDLAAP